MGLSPHGEFVLTGNGTTLTRRQALLLLSIARTGSISAAARDLNVSYKTAWEHISRLNSESRVPLVERAAGGVRGGGTRVTPAGRTLLDKFFALEQEHSAFIKKLSDDTPGRPGAPLLNQYPATIEALTSLGDRLEAQLRLSPALLLTAVLPLTLAQAMAIRENHPVRVWIPPEDVLLTTSQNVSTSARNTLKCKVTFIDRLGLQSRIMLDLGGGLSMGALVTRASEVRLRIAVGTRLSALFKASAVHLVPALPG